MNEPTHMITVEVWKTDTGWWRAQYMETQSMFVLPVGLPCITSVVELVMPIKVGDVVRSKSEPTTNTLGRLMRNATVIAIDDDVAWVKLNPCQQGFGSATHVNWRLSELEREP